MSDTTDETYELTRADISVIYGWLLGGVGGTEIPISVKGSAFSVLGNMLFLHNEQVGFIRADGRPYMYAFQQTKAMHSQAYQALKKLIEVEGY